MAELRFDYLLRSFRALLAQKRVPLASNVFEVLYYWLLRGTVIKAVLLWML